MELKRLAIVGSGDLGQQIAYHALNDKHYKPVGFFDDFNVVGTIKHNLPILGKTTDIVRLFEEDKFDTLLIGLGYKHFSLRKEFYETLKGKVPFGKIIHSSSYVDRSCKIGDGVFVYPGCTLDMNAEVKDNVAINVGCVIAHDSIISSHCFLSPAVKIAGFVTVGEMVSLGIGTTIIDNLNISPKVRTGAGAVVTKNLESEGLYVGIPAVFKKK